MPAGRLALARALERVKLGEHLCIVYEREDERRATAAPFIRSGLEQGDRCLFLVERENSEAVLADMRSDGIAVDPALASGALVVADPRDVYLGGGRFDASAVLRAWDDACTAALAAGFRTVRLAAEMTWTSGMGATVEEVLEYEAKLNDFVRSRAIAIICYYNRDKFSPAVIRGVLQTHPVVIYGGFASSNPYYIPPEEFLHSDEEAEIARLLRRLVDQERTQEQLRLANEELTKLTRRLVEVQETEHRELARELHDELGQLLTGIMLILQRSVDAVPDPARQWLHEVEALVTELIERVRDISLRLRPIVLDEFGLAAALRWYVHRYQGQTGVSVSLEVEDLADQRFPAEVEIAAYRIVQEALTNVARHARVSRATVRLWAGENDLHVQVVDQGVGFELAAADGTGLIGLRERAEALGGRLNITTAHGAGTSIEAELLL